MSSAQSPSSGDPPTYHHGITLTRRRALQAIGAAAVAGAASSGSVAADNGLVDGLKEAIGGVIDKTHWTMAVFAMPVFVGLVGGTWYRNSMNEDPTSDRVQLHQLVTNEAAWMNNHSVNFGNYLQDTRPIASLEARHGMASEWELGNGSSKGYDTALSRIRQYYCVPEFNHLHVSNKALLQLSYIAGAGQDTDPAYNIQTIGERVSDGSNVIVRISDAREQTKPVLHEGTVVDENALDNVDNLDGDDGRFITPVFDFLDAGDETLIGSKALGADELDAWDSTAQLSGRSNPGATTFVLEDGTEVLTDLRFTTQSVTDDGGDLDSTDSLLAFDGPEFFEILEEIRTLSDDVVAWYDQSFVEDIYGELDAGNITPEQVRSPEGMARFLSRTDDPTDERFQISWMQQFGFERPDLRIVRGMSVNWSGATETWVDPDPDLDDRHVYPDGYADAEQYNGIVFGSDVPVGGFQSGETYTVGPPTYGVGAGGTISSVDPFTGDLLASIGAYSADFSDSAISPDGRTLFVCGSFGVYAIDTSDGSELWHFDGNTESVDFVDVSPDGTTIIGGGWDNLTYGIAASDGTEQWTYSHGDGVTAGVFSHDSQTAYAASTNGDGVHAIDASDGSGVWSTPVTGQIQGIAISPDGEHLYFSESGDLREIDTADGSLGWTTTTGHSAPVATLPNGTVVAGDNDTAGDVRFFNPSDGSEKYAYEGGHTDGLNSLAVPPGGRFVYSADRAGELHAVDASDGSAMWVYSGSTTAYEGVSIMDPPAASGMAARSLIFDESTDDSSGQGQVDLWNGVLEIVKMWDAEGAEITHVDEQTIADIEALEGTPDSIETIVEEMDEFDSVDDIRYTRDVLAIIEHYGVDATVGNDDDSDVRTTEPDYTDQDYDAVTSAEFAEAMAELEELIAQLESENEEANSSTEDDEPLFGGLFGSFDGGGSTILGFGLIAAVVLAVVGIVTDLIPGLGN
ncbi:PQQ-binding-like beta-propeller repeat protein [Natronosalvus caseinilyticus]|uniref:outer membrane protein assembly factor BamB family protein n=1 Tax=Natronosalvus caseinilyticus TaxID=2953747 RepID=UPI0028A87832|nr:PQQ-binding-like beta-propeller repeat protein [Natronosalvus caseinilyticus]